MSEVSDARKIIRQLTKKVVSFFPAFAEISDSAKAGLFLSQAFFWTEDTHNEREDGWFFKSSKEWAKETGLTKHEQDTCREILSKLGLLTQELRDSPPKCYFKVEIDAVIKALLNLPESGKLAAGKRQNELPESGKISFKEITLESTEESAPPAPLTTQEFCPECGFEKKMCMGHKKPKTRKYPNRQRFEREIVQRVQEKRKGSTGEERAAILRERGKVLLDPAFLAREAKRVLQAAATDRGLARNLQAWSKAPEPD